MTNKDLFSGHSGLYSAYRPTYPDDLYQFLYKHLHSFERAWDAGCGNGQVSRDLSKRFGEVEATDISDRQLSQAYQAENIHYFVAGEVTNFADQCFDLVCVAQAIHWFNISLFYNEVERVLKPDGLIAVWGYNLIRISKEIDHLVSVFYRDVVGSYWDPERKLIEEEYQRIEFPFKSIATPAFEIKTQWTLTELEGYINSWSSVQKYIIHHQTNPVGHLMTDIKKHWTDGKRLVSFRIFMKAGKLII